MEFQTRREYKGAGLHPYYVGWEYEFYFQKLKNLKSLIGISVWCQTGGLSRFKSLTFLENSSVWNELNTHATIKIIKQKMSPEKAALDYFQNHQYHSLASEEMVRFLKLYTLQFQKLLYVEGFSNRPFYFKKLRVPPTLWIFWGYISLNPFIKELHRLFEKDEISLDMKALKSGRNFGKKIGVPNIDYHYDTLEIFWHCRKFLRGDGELQKLSSLIRQYLKKYPQHYDFSVQASSGCHWGKQKLIKLLLRPHPEYRLIDRILFSKFISTLLYLILICGYRKNLPGFAKKHFYHPKTIFS